MANEFHQRMRRIEELIQTIEAASDPNLRADALELIRSLMGLHGTSLDRMMESIAQAGEAGRSILESFASDEAIASLLLVYGLHPVDIEARVKRALDKVRPYLNSHGGSVELLAIDQQVVKLRLKGTCNGCPSSRITIKLAIEQAIYETAPDAAGIEVEGLVEPEPRLAKVANGDGVSHENTQSVAWEKVSGLDSLASGAARLVQVDGRTILFCRLGETFYAYAAFCTACKEKLVNHDLQAGAIVCPACGRRYDAVRAGRALDQENIHLEPFPILGTSAEMKIALPVQMEVKEDSHAEARHYL
ncbi:MAG: NifU family protein [Candidatus Binatia bacterium]